MTAREVGAALFVLLAAGVALAYRQVEEPHAIFLILGVLVWLALFTLAAIGLGAPIWRWVSGEPLAGAESWVVAAAAGAAALAAAAGAWGAVGLLRPLPLLATLGAAGALGAVTIRRACPGPLPFGRPFFPAAIVLFGATLTLFAVGTPSPFYDQVHYHLAFPERWLRAGTLIVYPRQSYSYLAANMGLLYTYALAGPGVWGAQALHAWMGALTLGGAAVVARKLGAGHAGAIWAAAFLVATPSFLLSASWAASDLAVAAFGVAAAVLALGAWDPARGPSSQALAGVLCGAAFGCKYTALGSVVLPVATILLGSIVTLRRGTLGLLAWGAGFAASFLPWAARNVLATGDPIYPFLAPGEKLTAAGISAVAGDAGSWGSLLTLRTFDALGAAGWIGPLWLVLLPLWLVPALAGRRTVRGLWLGVSVLAGLVLWTRMHQLGRYLLPALALGAGGIGMAWERFQSTLAPGLRRASFALVALLALWGLQGGIADETLTRVACTLGRSDPQNLLERYVTYWGARDIVRERLPEDARLLLVGEPRAFGIEREVDVEDPFGTPLLVELAEEAADGPGLLRLLRERGITHLLYNEAEASRIAFSRGRPGYFSDASPAATERLQQFLEDCLDPVGEAGPVRVVSLAADCRVR